MESSFSEYFLIININLAKMEKKYYFGSGEIRTRASEETGALNQRLRPLGHATFSFDHRLQQYKSKLRIKCLFFDQLVQ